ncbi:hypothetical protein HPB49_006516 [Dermacentor silvarum]|uniref:Uncharacterized protein n=1 Tax=Dermacentor silvarum TaxID=543639 RepID=A0ACB8D3K1_DERSI|nr:hypothetical protein HPB49_006516 [Dermacentor silvarum]
MSVGAGYVCSTATEDPSSPLNLNEKAHRAARELTYRGSDSDGPTPRTPREGGEDCGGGDGEDGGGDDDDEVAIQDDRDRLVTSYLLSKITYPTRVCDVFGALHGKRVGRGAPRIAVAFPPTQASFAAERALGQSAAICEINPENQDLASCVVPSPPGSCSSLSQAELPPFFTEYRWVINPGKKNQILGRQSHVTPASTFAAKKRCADHTAKRVIRRGGCRSIARILSCIEKESVRNRACRGLANIAMTSRGAKAIHGCKAVEHIVTFLTSPTSCESQVTALRAVRILANTPECRDDLVSCKAPAAAVKFLQTEALQKPAVQALASLTQSCSVECALQIKEADGFKILEELLQASDSGVLESAFAALVNLSVVGDVRPDLGAAQAISALIRQLSDYKLAKPNARARWLAAIQRDKWSPNTTSCYTNVCSRHFKEEDFIEGKRRRLKKGAVPPIFEEYPSHLLPKSTPARNTASIDKRVSATMARNDSASGSAMQQLKPAAAPTSSVEDMSDCCSMDTSTAPNSCDQSVQVNIRSTSSVLVIERAKWIRKEKGLRSQLLRLQ